MNSVPGEMKGEAVRLRNAVAYNAGLGIAIERLLTDNAAALRSREFIAARATLGIRNKFIRACRIQTVGKASRFIQSALRDWTYG
ncbi:integrase family protein [Acidovorax sp. CF316]|nr:integrase family protein [Acidovorax sp. CF316]